MTSLDVSGNELVEEGTKLLAEALKGNQIMTELNLSSNCMTGGGMSGVVALADAIPDMRALSSLVLKDNRLLNAEAGKVLSDMLATNTVLKVLDLSSNNWKKYGTSGDLMGDGPGFAKELAVGINDNGAMTKLDMSNNYFNGAAAGKAIGGMLTGNSTLKDLYLSGCGIDSDAAKGISKGLAGNGAMTKLDISKNRLFAVGTKLLAEALDGNQIITELNISGNDATWNGRKRGEMPDVTALASVIPGMGALTKLCLKNNIMLTKDAGKALASALARNSVLTELDVSSQAGCSLDDGPGFGQELAVGISDNGAMTSLDISSNSIGICDGDDLPEGWTYDGYYNLYCHKDHGDQSSPPAGAKLRGIIAIADAIPDMRALTNIDISSNCLYAAGTKVIAEALKGNQIMTCLNLAYNLMEADGALDIAKTIPTMGAMTSLNLASNKLGVKGAKIITACLPKCT
jgi:Ran GTPase-activating protein (RanGAP) involved in mRNA processing and transport